MDAKGRSIYTVLARRVPIFNKKEEVLISLCEHNVPIMRGVWLIKMTAAYALAMSETSKTKKRQVRQQIKCRISYHQHQYPWLNMNFKCYFFQALDPGMEWTHSLVKFLKEQLSELSKLISNYASNMNSNSSIPGN